MRRAINERIAPIAKVAVVGTGQLRAGSRRRRLPAPQQDLGGEEVFNMACVACHGAGVAGAPKFGDTAAWGPRIAKGADTLHKHALEGFQGQAGFMPPKGGATDLSDKSIMNAVDYMVAAVEEVRVRLSLTHMAARIRCILLSVGFSLTSSDPARAAPSLRRHGGRRSASVCARSAIVRATFSMR